MQKWEGVLEKIDDYRWRIPKKNYPGMRVDGVIYAKESLLPHIRMDQTPLQVANVAHLPGIVKYSLAMPDIHWGYGFPIGGVAAIDPDTGVVSPGGVGYDINCGVRVLRTDLRKKDIENRIKQLVDALFVNVPCGIGSKTKRKFSENELKEAMRLGSKWIIKKGYGWEEDVSVTEENGCLDFANPDFLSNRAIERGKPQIGTLGAGNHFLEIQEIDEVYDEDAAKVMGLEKGLITVMIHTGSRGLGYQVCDDNVRIMGKAMQKYGINVPDRQLACVPVRSEEGKKYLGAMAAAANYAWVNRQMIMFWVREAFEKIMGTTAEKLGMHLIYDVAHNIAKFEEHRVNGETRTLCVHRKGATRAFPPNHPKIPLKYKKIGQPVIIPGDMGSHSYILVGTKRAMEETFGSTCHGAGRVMSRHKALDATKGRAIFRELEDIGIYVRSASVKTLREETPEAYKNIEEVVDTVHMAGIGKKVVRMRPLGVIKG
ncbi:MAG: RNA-splicing ligase RtcB [Candidatus Cloacimonas sp. 4484_209]|nr:MAG: RNA-splicing ligase RtcB [Candidatus Cloacimonas sp. 4484_209]